MARAFAFDEIGRLPLPGDNVAIATRRLESGTRILYDGRELAVDHTVLEGHRFAVQPIAVGEALLSWQLPFGFATTAIAPGNYVCNGSTLAALSGRQLDFDLPAAPNFAERIKPYQLDETTFQPASPLPRHVHYRTFLGFRRPGGRGVGTRNYIVLLGVTSRVGPFVKRLEARLKSLVAGLPNIDGVVAVAHTEGGDNEHPNNLHLTLPTLIGFMVNPNVGAVLAIDDGVGAVTNEALHTYVEEHGYALDAVRHHFMTLETSFAAALDAGAAIVEAWLPEVNRDERTPESLAFLKIALQCGGSDAFSGVSGNPLAGWVAREVLRYGGSANLAETDELIGAEPYVLQKVRNLETARKFLSTIERFQEWASWHGASAEGNPSGGNKYRGLYNITLKSIGAAMKRDPDVPLDYVIDYAEPMREPGYYFMDSPGNDLESIAGQVASGCNLIFFVTGNGSVTNFPFAPTIKIVTTSERFALLHKDMDVNAGRYLDGMPMDELGREMLDLTVDVASGRQSVGERAGHAQVQLWRNWRQQANAPIEEITQVESFDGLPIAVSPPAPIDAEIADLCFDAVDVNGAPIGRPVGLILPTSLCAAQVAQMAAQRLNNSLIGEALGVERFVALVHTEGCGCSPAAKDLTSQTLLGYLRHPLVAYALLLEHGCEITHNDHMRHAMREVGLNPSDFGWASIQMDGGIQRVLDRVDGWFGEQAAEMTSPEAVASQLVRHRFGFYSEGDVSPAAAQCLGLLASQIVAGGGTVVVPSNTSLLTSNAFQDRMGLANTPRPSLAFGQHVERPGFHIMATPTGHWVETLVGLGAAGVEAAVAAVDAMPMAGHPLVPVMQVTANETVAQRYGDDLDLSLSGDALTDARGMATYMACVLAGTEQTAVERNGNVDFQLTRGLLGITL